MRAFPFETVDVFTETRFGGNPLAVFTDARGMSDADMQALAFEMNYSETTFVLPPADAANTARMRIFSPKSEMPFAGHPSVGTAYVLARAGKGEAGKLRLETLAGVVAVDIEHDASGAPVGGRISAPQPLSLDGEFAAAAIAECAGLTSTDIIVSSHRPLLASVGNPFVIAQVSEDALVRAAPDAAAFQRIVDRRPELKGRFSLHLYARDGDNLHARMFAPLAGIVEDPATGSANATLAALLLHLSDAKEGHFNIRQGAEMGRPSQLHATARRQDGSVTATIAGRCTPVMRGEALL